MKALILIAMSLLMGIFALGGLQTIEWCTDQGYPIPWQTYALLACVAIWCIIMVRMPRKDYEKMGKLLDRLSGEK